MQHLVFAQQGSEQICLAPFSDERHERPESGVAATARASNIGIITFVSTAIIDRIKSARRRAQPRGGNTGTSRQSSEERPLLHPDAKEMVSPFRVVGVFRGRNSPLFRPLLWVA